MKYLFPVCALLSVACTGIFDGQTSGQSSTDAVQNPAVTGGVGMGSTTKTSTSTTTPAGAPFKVNNTRPELVPFDMRVRRIATAIGVDVNHAMFTDMYRNSLKLGDYDYANGVLSDGSWNANRIAAWMNVLKPVCNSTEFKTKYPVLPDNLPALIRAAWGHVPSAEDTADFQNAIVAAGATPTVNYESTCMAVFTAAEFVYR